MIACGLCSVSALSMLAVDALLRHHHVMVDALAMYLYEPSVVPTVFGIYALLGLVGEIMATMWL
jgi:hypothetical protein